MSGISRSWTEIIFNKNCYEFLEEDSVTDYNNSALNQKLFLDHVKKMIPQLNPLYYFGRVMLTTEH